MHNWKYPQKKYVSYFTLTNPSTFTCIKRKPTFSRSSVNYLTPRYFSIQNAWTTILTYWYQSTFLKLALQLNHRVSHNSKWASYWPSRCLHTYINVKCLSRIVPIFRFQSFWLTHRKLSSALDTLLLLKCTAAACVFLCLCLHTNDYIS